MKNIISVIFIFLFSCVIALQTSAQDYSDDDIYTVVDEKPQFPGGDEDLKQWINSNVQYPIIAIQENIQGRVFVKFIIEKDGSIGKVEIARGRHPELDKEAIRVIRSIPFKFKPAILKGKAVRTWFTYPVTFKLQDY